MKEWGIDAQRQWCTRVDLAEIRVREQEATQRLLGDTIAIDDMAWQAPARLPGLTRAHVATHLARNADAFARALDAAATQRQTWMYDSPRLRERALERGSERSALELQIDLDTSAGRLYSHYDSLAALGDAVIELPSGSQFLASLVPIIRLNELTLHHVDLDCGFEITTIRPDVAACLVELNAALMGDAGPAARIRTTSGVSVEIGSGDARQEIYGDDATMLGWMTGRLNPDETERHGLPWQPVLF